MEEKNKNHIFDVPQKIKDKEASVNTNSSGEVWSESRKIG